MENILHNSDKDQNEGITKLFLPYENHLAKNISLIWFSITKNPVKQKISTLIGKKFDNQSIRLDVKVEAVKWNTWIKQANK